MSDLNREEDWKFTSEKARPFCLDPAHAALAAALEAAEKELAEWKISASDQGLPLPSETIQRRLAAAEARVAEAANLLERAVQADTWRGCLGLVRAALRALAVSFDTSKETE